MSIKTELLKKLGFGSQVSSGDISKTPPEEPIDSDPVEACVNRQSEIVNKQVPHLPHIESASRRLTGKVAKLPRGIRTQVNALLDDGITYNEICSILEKLGYPGFVHQNIQRWKDNGYKRWARRQQELEEDRLETEYAHEVVEDPKAAAHLAESNEMKLALKTSHLLDRVRSWDPDEILTGDKAKIFFQLSRSVTLQLTQRTRRELAKSEIDLRNRKNEISEEAKQKIRALTEPLTKEERDAILDKIDELLGIRLDFDTNGTPATLQTRAGQGEKGIPQGSGDNPKPETSSPEHETRNTESETPAPIAETTRPAETYGNRQSKIVNAEATSPLSQLPPVKSRSTEAEIPEVHANAPECTVETSSPSEPPVQSESSVVKHTHSSANSAVSVSSVLKGVVPISPLAPKPPVPKQPRNHVPVFDLFGAVVEWLPCEGPNSQPTFPDATGFDNRRGQTLCWLDPKRPYNLEPPAHWKIAILDSEARIIGWTPHHITPSETAVPLRARAYIGYTVAWHEDTTKRDPNADRVGALVG
jgi:hypothetical protein